MNSSFPFAKACRLAVAAAMAISVRAAENVALVEVPDYSWHAGCFGTAGGNLMGYWDRHGFPDFYTGPTNDGLAPLNSNGGNEGIRSMWASKAGFDGRSSIQMGHIDDYWQFYTSQQRSSYESTAPDPHLTAGRAEHEPDCIGDFIGASQNKWTDLNGECDGNIDGYAVTYWDLSGQRRVNYVPPAQGGRLVPDLPSGLRAWTQFRGYDAMVSSQLTDFNSAVPAGQGFSFSDLKAEIDGGYPVVLFLQKFNDFSRFLPGMPRANPNVHGMLAYGYYVTDGGNQFVRYKTSWGGSGEHRLHLWDAGDWEAQLPLRGVICYRPLPKIKSFELNGSTLRIAWDGPSSWMTNYVDGTSQFLHRYIVEKAGAIQGEAFRPVTGPTERREAIVENCCPGPAFFRVRLLDP